MLFVGSGSRAAANAEHSVRLTHEASALLNQYAGRSSLLNEAKQLLDRVIVADPAYPPAYVELARYHMKARHKVSRDSRPGPLEAAEEALNRALALDPHFANALVLLGNLRYLQWRYQDSEEALTRAEQLGTLNPWLHLNWADILFAQNKYEAARARSLIVIDRGTDIASAMSSALSGLIRYEKRQKNFTAVRELHERLVSLHPTAWNFGSFAFDLLHYLGDVDGAIKIYRTALAQMNYGVGRVGLARAFYAKWAQLKDMGHEQAAQDYFDAAQRIQPDLNEVMVTSAEFYASQFVAAALNRYHNVSFDVRNARGRTALVHAAINGEGDAVRGLLALGARPTVSGSSEPLCRAAARGNHDVVSILLESGLKLNFDCAGRSADGIARDAGHFALAAKIRRAMHKAR
ncbi:MAG: ankyrin repeat domain-containing protein [Gammaproteobacteria bacterium]|nr:ankyrin repeat domain-containing protein [Gammaproteobacteria bacterium]